MVKPFLLAFWWSAVKEPGVMVSKDPKSLFSDLSKLWYERRPAPGHIPSRKAFDIRDFAHCIGWISIYGIESYDPLQLRIRLVGEEIVNLDGANNTGKLLSQVFPVDEYPEVYQPYLDALASGEPIITSRSLLTLKGAERQLSKLVLPTATDGRNIDKFIVVLFYERLSSDEWEKNRETLAI